MLWSAKKLYQYRRQAPLSFLFLPCSFPFYLLSLPPWPSYFCTFPPSLVISFPKTTIVFAKCLKKTILVLVSEVPWLYMWLYYFVRLWFISRLTEILLFSQILCFNVSPRLSLLDMFLKLSPLVYAFLSCISLDLSVLVWFCFPPTFWKVSCTLLYFLLLLLTLLRETRRSQGLWGFNWYSAQVKDVLLSRKDMKSWGTAFVCINCSVLTPV